MRSQSYREFFVFLLCLRCHTLCLRGDGCTRLEHWQQTRLDPTARGVGWRPPLAEHMANTDTEQKLRAGALIIRLASRPVVWVKHNSSTGNRKGSSLSRPDINHLQICVVPGCLPPRLVHSALRRQEWYVPTRWLVEARVLVWKESMMRLACKLLEIVYYSEAGTNGCGGRTLEPMISHKPRMTFPALLETDIVYPTSPE